MGYDWAQKCQHIEFGMVTCSRRSSPPSSSSSSSISTHASHSPLFTNTMSSVSTSTNTQTHTTSHDNVLSLPDNDDESHDDDTDKPKVNGMSTRKYARQTTVTFPTFYVFFRVRFQEAVIVLKKEKQRLLFLFSRA
jgi:hypothetical protein